MFPNVNDIPPPEPGDETDLENLAAKWYAGAIKQGGAAAVVSSLAKPIVGIFAAIFSFLLTLLDPIAVALLKAILQGFDTVVDGPLDSIGQVVLEEYRLALGGGGGHGAGTTSQGEAIARLFIERIVGTLPAAGGAGIDPSLEPANQFLGMMTALTVRGWLLGVLGELETGGYIKGFEDLVADISRTIGTGRLTRVALRPLIEAVIGDPAKQYVYQAYRPTLLQPELAVKQVLRGFWDKGAAATELAKAGYSADRIDAFFHASQALLGIGELLKLEDNGITDSTVTLAIGQQHGYSVDDLGRLSQLYNAERSRELGRREAALFLDQLRAGEATYDDVVGAVDALQLNDGDKGEYKALAKVIVSVPRRHLTVAQLESMYSRNLIDAVEFRAYLTRIGYSDDDVTLIYMLENTTLNDKAEAARVKAATKAQVAADKQAALVAKAAAAADKKAALEAARQQKQQLAADKQAAADQAHLARIQLSAQAIQEHAAAIDAAHSQQLITSQQAADATAALNATLQQHTLEANAALADQAAGDQAASKIDAAAVEQQILAERVAAKTKAARARADLDQQLLDARQADRVAAFQLERDSAQASFDAGEITAKQLATKLRSIDLAEKKAIADENVTSLQITRAQASADQIAATGTIDESALTDKTAALTPALQRRQDQIAAQLTSHLQTAAATSTAKTAARQQLAQARVAAVDAANQRRDAVDAQIAQQKLALETQIIQNRPKA